VIHPPAGLPVRPTTDFAKTGLFNILNNIKDPSNCSVLDLYAGTGSISLEFISRHAQKVVSVDREKKCLEFIRKTASAFGADNITTIRDEAFRFIKKSKYTFDIIFADPPFSMTDKESLVILIMESGILNPDGLVVLEHPAEESYTDVTGFLSERKYGHIKFSFFHTILAEK
jgi:16S rRNA (guanine966-N2)-methyltransferase